MLRNSHANASLGLHLDSLERIVLQARNKVDVEVRTTLQIAHRHGTVKRQFIASLPIIQLLDQGQFLTGATAFVKPESDREWLVALKVSNVSKTQVCLSVELASPLDDVRPERDFTPEGLGVLIVS